jgi:hypothetical protein
LGFERLARSAVLSCVLATLAAPRAARADEPDAGIRMAARELAVAGAEAFDKQDYTTALDRFERAEKLYKAPSISVMVARCLARTGHLVEAVDKYEETSHMPVDAGAPEAFQRAVSDAAAEVDAVRKQVARLELNLAPDTPDDVKVSIDGKALPPALLGVPVPVNPGTHHITARAAERAVFRADVNVVEAGKQSLRIQLSPLAAEAPAAPPPDAAKASSSSAVSPWAWVMVGTAGVGVATGSIVGAAALGHKSHLDAVCKPGCPHTSGEDLSAYRRDRAISYVSFGVSLVAAGVGTYLFVRREPTGDQVGLLVGPGSAAIRGSF